jgi:hypothetical protein
MSKHEHGAMEPRKSSYIDTLIKLFDAVVNHQETAELEGIVSHGRVTETMFLRLLQYLNATMSKPVDTEQLDVGIQRGRDRYRIEITGRENVVGFIKGDQRLSHIDVPLRLIVKGFMQGYRPLELDACDTRVNLKTETEVMSQRRDLLRTLTGLRQRIYRLKKRFTFATQDNLFRIDATIVRTSNVTNGESALASGVLSAPKTYEVEIEYIGNASSVSTAALSTTLIKYAMEVKMAMEGDDTYMTPTLRDAIMADIKSIFGTDRFIGPMPVTLERNNMIDNEYNNDSILKDYTVTDKADGERCLLYTSAVSHGSVFKISKQGGKIVMKKTNIAFESDKAGACIVDCEHVTMTKSSEKMSEFMVFDAYCIYGEPIGHLPLMAGSDVASRLQRAFEIVSKFKQSEHAIGVKRFYDDIFKGAQEIMALHRCGRIKYHIDGLIYTPKNMALGALFDTDKPHYGSVWEKVYKWKPPQDNSIDFMVHFVGRPLPSSSGDGLPLLQWVDLYVGADKRIVANNGRIAPLEGLKALSGQIRYVGAAQGYEDRKFIVEPNDESVSSTHIPIDLDSNKPLCMSGEAIDHLSVVEMVRVGDKWVPLRLRPDKVHGNDLHAALNVWRSICEPLNEDIVLGSTKLHASTYLADIENSDVYYNRNLSRNKPSNRAASRGIKDFHNNFVKRALVQKLAIAGKCKTVFDIACGKAGDLFKYLDNGFDCIVGADKSSDNIENATDGAYARAIDIINNPIKSIRKERARTGTIAFFEADFGSRIDDTYMEGIQENDKRALFKMLWLGSMPPGKDADGAMYAKYRGVVKRRFDMAACQFAIHYFMSSHKTISAFATNLDNVLKPNGYFVGTCLDGRIVDRALRNSGGDEIRGVRGGRLVWSIKNMYGILDEDGNNFGKKVRVFMETINQPIDEYLVDFDLLANELAKKGILPLETKECTEFGLINYTGTFRDIYEELQTQNTGFSSTVGGLMSDEEKQYSFMNRWFVFKKKS